MRCLFFFRAKFDLALWAEHLPGKCNGAADALSCDDRILFLSQVTSAQRDPGRVGRGPGAQTAGLDIKELNRAAQKYYPKGLAESTQRSYWSAQKRFLTFCDEGKFRAVPVSGEILGRYLSYLAESGLKHRTIKVYLSAIRFLHIAEGEADPFKPTLLQLHYILQGIKRSEAQKQVEKRPRLPVSPSIFRKLKHIWEESSQPNRIMLWAACCL